MPLAYALGHAPFGVRAPDGGSRHIAALTALHVYRPCRRLRNAPTALPRAPQVGTVDNNRQMINVALVMAAKSPRVMAAIRAEQDAVVAQHGEALTGEALRAMVYLQAVIDESSRILPAAQARGARFGLLCTTPPAGGASIQSPSVPTPCLAHFLCARLGGLLRKARRLTC